LEHEFRAQIETVLAEGLQPTHVDSHCLVHTRREDIFDMTVGLAREYGLAVRVNQAFSQKIKQQGYACVDYELLNSYDLETRTKPEIYYQFLQGLPPGLSEWAVHPSTTTAELQAMSDSWPVRQADYEFLMSPETQRLLAQEGIIVLDYGPLQALWK
jgi:hypothetical protein